MSSKILAGIAIAMAVSGCAFFPSTSPYLTDKETLAATGLDGSGVLAFSPRSEAEEEIYLDLTNLDSDKNFRVQMNPGFAYHTLAMAFGAAPSPDSLVYAKVISRNVAFYALPKGRYRPLFLGYQGKGNNRNAFRVDADTFSIQDGKITSLGFLQVSYLWSPTIQPVGPDIDSLIRHASDPAIARMEIVRAKLVLDRKASLRAKGAVAP
jgi:hypothetical protein